MIRSVIIDTRNPGKWTPADFARTPDLWIVGTSTTPTHVTGMRGRVHLHFQPAIFYNSLGEPANAYNEELYAIAAGAGALTDLPMEPGGADLRFLDLYPRGIGAAIGTMILRRFPWIAGLNLDYCNPKWMPKELWGGKMPRNMDPDTYWWRYNANIAAMVATVRAGKSWFLTTGQVDAMPDDGALNSALNGLKLEQFPTFNGRTLEFHAEQKRIFDAMLKSLGRESLWICELRYPESLGPTYIAQAVEWAKVNGLALSYGVDATAKVLA